MADIIKEILKDLPADKISDAAYEGANIVLYTKDTDFFLNNNGIVKKVVDIIKKRVELRPDPSITMDMEKAEEEIKNENEYGGGTKQTKRVGGTTRII